MFRVAIFIVAVAVNANSQSLSEMLDRTSRRAERFVEDFSSVKCTERTNQVKLDGKGKALFRQTRLFDYLIFVKVTDGKPKVEESRLNQEKVFRESADSLLVTGGFGTLALIFHPQIRDNYSFVDLGEDPTIAKRLHKIYFESKSDAQAMAVLRLGSRNYPIEWQGTAWIDADTGDVYRIHASLKSPMTDVGLRSLETDVNYAPTRFADSPGSFWLPRSASIEVETLRQHWRNVHEFDDYRLFSVTTSTREGGR